MTAEIVQFPAERRDATWSKADRERPCLVLILPIVRIERWDGSLTPEERDLLLAADRRRPTRRRRPKK